jgi:hypothetical protein
MAKRREIDKLKPRRRIEIDQLKPKKPVVVRGLDRSPPTEKKFVVVTDNDLPPTSVPDDEQLTANALGELECFVAKYGHRHLKQLDGVIRAIDQVLERLQPRARPRRVRATQRP